MGLIWFIVGTIVFGNVMAGVVAVLLGKSLFKSGRKLLKQARERGMLPGQQAPASQEAQDVVVEPVVEESDARNGRPQAPEGVGHAKTQQGPKTQRPQPTPQPATSEVHDYVRLDVDDGADEEAICEVMRSYVNDDVTGSRARGVIDTLGSAKRRRKILFAELDGTFHEGTLSWDKFAGPAYAAYDAILRNSALLANRIQAFDTAGYRRLEDAMHSWSNTNGGKVSETRERRWQLYQEMLTSLDTLQETNEGLLLELDALAAEVSTISGTGTGDRSDQIIEEIHRLVEEAKYYRDSTR